VSVARTAPRVEVGRLVKALAVFGVPELSLLSFYFIVIVGLSVVQRNARLDLHLAAVSAIAVAYVLGAWFLRPRGVDRQANLRRIVRRILTMVVLFSMYFQLRWIIPAIHPGDHDVIYNNADIAIFGAPVAELLFPYQTHFWVEWFSFFYFAYLHLIAVYVFAHIFLDHDGRHFAPLGSGMIMMHAPIVWGTYFIAPGIGPYAYLKDTVPSLPGGEFLQRSMNAYMLGPLRDIFPSLHTAVMTFLSIHALRNWNRHWIYRVVAIPFVFWALQIVIATIYCRWHYAVDVVAGLAVGVACTFLADYLSRRWAEVRTAAGELDPWF
jgi:membrane-associated phospholipid phosphatase